MRSPSHIRPFISDIGKFISVLPGEIEELFVGYQVRCTCGNCVFKVSRNLRPLIIAHCTKCFNNIILYDVNLYSNASSYSNEGEMEQVYGPNGEDVYSICIAFEYPEPDDEEYGDNDISWCYIYGIPNENPSKAFTILNDETI